MQAQRARFFFAAERFAAGCSRQRNEPCEQIEIEAAYGSPHIAAKTTEEVHNVKRLYGKTVQQGGKTAAPCELSQTKEAGIKDKDSEDLEPQQSQTKNRFIQTTKSVDLARARLFAAVNNFW